MVMGCAARANVLRKLLKTASAQKCTETGTESTAWSTCLPPSNGRGKVQREERTGHYLLSESSAVVRPSLRLPSASPVLSLPLLRPRPSLPPDGRSEVHLTERGRLAKYKRRGDSGRASEGESDFRTWSMVRDPLLSHRNLPKSQHKG